MTQAKFTNRLAGETSPYLLQHAHNPVDWYPWGPEALERAQREDKPILLSIGYAACHWCHVMERESFENEQIAALMNQHFVCIKVDREERPDLDQIYMAATVAMSGSGGWPMTVFLLPNQQPFFAGTYYPPIDKYGRPGFPTLLQRIAQLWNSERDQLQAQAAALTSHVREQAGAGRPGSVGEDTIAKAVRQWSGSFDSRHGGFGTAPKFPPSPALLLLLRVYQRSGDEAARKMVTTTLDAMMNGGIYDQLAGGFARYSTDERWLVPHFEKMLYDNAQLARVYVEAYQATANSEYRRVAVETLDYVLREMQSPAGGYYSATDADSEGEEGKYFVWDFHELRSLLDSDQADAFCAFYDVTPDGNWEGKNVLNRPRTAAAVAADLGYDEARLAQLLKSATDKLREERARRVPPLLDDKILTSWNGLMISAMAEGYRVLRDPRYLDSAERAASYVLSRLRRDDGRLLRTARGDKVHLAAYLEDYAYLADALIDLYEAGAAISHLQAARALAERILEDFADPNTGAFFQTAKDHESLIVRTLEGNDGALPSANAVAARALARLAVHFDRESLRDSASAAIRAYGQLITSSPRAFATSLSASLLLMEQPIELAVIGDPAHHSTEALWSELARHYLPHRVIAHQHPARDPEPPELPLLSGKGLVGGQSAVYVCRNFACQAPVTTPAELAARLQQTAAESGTTRAAHVAGKRIAGAASAKGTAEYATNYAKAYGPGAYAELGSTGLLVSRLGFGGYRVTDAAVPHRRALEKALREGCNLIDTSTNYTSGGSERLVGEVLRQLIDAGELSRSEVVVVSKIGYVQGENLELARAREEQGRPFPEMVTYADDVWHDIHPEWLDDQLTRSLDRLGLETLDVCLLHNPEYYFTDAVKKGRGPLDGLRQEFYERLERAFQHLEREVSRGRIQVYGISSNTFGAPRDHREHVDLAEVLDVVERAVGAEHHFRVIQLPMNLLEPGALLEPQSTKHDKPVLQLAAERRIGVLVNRPLNAITQNALLRLVDPPELTSDVEFGEQRLVVAGLEQEFRQTIATQLRSDANTPAPTTLFAWADQLAQLPAQLESLEQWREIEDHLIAPRIAQLLSALDRVLVGPAAPSWRSWRDRYLPELDRLLASLRTLAAGRSRLRMKRIRGAMSDLLPEEQRAEPLSRTAVWAVTSAPGVSSVLVGMRNEAYVADLLPTLAWPKLLAPERVLSAIREMGE